MKTQESVFTTQSVAVAIKVFFSLIKMGLISLVLIVGVLVLSQSSVSPVSVRLLAMYGLEYAAHTLKPLRPYFPEPYVVELETK